MAMTLPYVRFNGGEVDEDIDVRADIENYDSLASVQENCFANMQGRLYFRPGLEKILTLDSQTLPFAFRYSIDESYVLLQSDHAMRVLVDGAVPVRAAVSATVSATWINASSGDATATSAGTALTLTGNAAGTAVMRQQIVTGSANVRHALRMTVGQGPVTFRAGYTAGASDLVSNQTLKAGVHSLAFTPTGSFWIEFESTIETPVTVASVTFETAAPVVIPTPWALADLPKLQSTQSLDVQFVGSSSYRPQRIERRGPTSWSIVDMGFADGPYRTPNLDEKHLLSNASYRGVTTLTSSKPFFLPAHVGALFRLTHTGQNRQDTFTGADQWSEPIKVSSVDSAREISFAITGTFVATVRLQRSVGNTLSWENVTGQSWTAPASATYNDTFDNQIIYYRFGIDTGDYTSGSALISVTYSSGSTNGTCQVSAYVSSTVVTVDVLTPFGKIGQTKDWAEGDWSPARGWPTSVTLHDGRLWLGRNDQFWGSFSDGFENFQSGDLDTNAISRKVATGDVSPIQWLIGLTRLLIGTQAAEVGVRASNFDIPLTNSNLTVRDISTNGAFARPAIKIDDAMIFIDRTGQRLHRIAYDNRSNDYATNDTFRFHPDVAETGIVQMAVARKPHTRVFMVRGDGQCIVYLYHPEENVLSLSRFVTDGLFEGVCVTPAKSSSLQDDIYFTIARKKGDGSTVRTLEKLAKIKIKSTTSACNADSYVRYSGVPIQTVSGLDHLEGREVVVWADGAAQNRKTVSGGQITLGRAASNVVVGLYYEGRYRGLQLIAGARNGTAIAQIKRLFRTQLLVRDSVAAGILYGPDFENMDRLPDRDYETSHDTSPGLWSGITEPLSIEGRHGRDPRLCLKFEAPFPVSIKAYTSGDQLNERA